jgi:hypothetical protein
MQLIIKFTIIIWILFGLNALVSQEIGASWEFNTAGNTEGWGVSKTFTDLSVSGGTLKATVSGDFPYFTGPDFKLAASEYGFILVRLKAAGATSAIFYWEPDHLTWGFVRVDLHGDSSFHEYAIPVFQNKNWTSNILKINRLMVNAPRETSVEIDYIRIARVGFKPEIRTFSRLRTVLKAGQPFPLYAVILNAGDQTGRVSATLQLPDAFELIDGNSFHTFENQVPGATDTLRWTVRSPQTGSFDLALRLTTADTVLATESMPVSVVDTFWQQTEFFLSAWSPPGLSTAAYEYYTQANFDLVLSLPPDESAVNRVEQFKMRCLLSAGGILDENRFLRAPDNKIPETLTPAHLAQLDPLVEQFKEQEAVLGYYLTDEPNARAFQNLGKVVAYLREKDPTRLSFINLFPTYANEEQLGTKTYDEHVQQFIEIVKPELLSYDHYHFFKGYDGAGYFSNLGIIRYWAQKYDLPFCNIIQAIGADFLNWRIPTAAEHRWLVYSSLAYGAKAIIWFHWDHEWGLTSSPARDQLYHSIQTLNQEIKNLGPILLKLKSEAVYHSLKIPSGDASWPAGALVQSVSPEADLVIGCFTDENQRQYILLMNKSYQDSVTAEITLASGTNAAKMFNVQSNNWQAVTTETTDTGTRFLANFLPGGGLLYLLEQQADVAAPQNRVVTELKLLRNYPNPFNSSTTIEYELTQKSPVKIVIYDSLGREISVLLDKVQTAGNHRLAWDAQEYASGIYLIKLTTAVGEQTRKISLVK